MARPFKQGVDYFPLDVHMDNKFKFIEIKFGLEGFAIVIKMLQNIYSQGYWSDWGEDEKVLFSDEQRISYERLNEITDECVKRGIFDEGLYEEYNILTSSGIQKRYKEIVRRRKEVMLKEEYLLIPELKEVNDDINPSLSSQNDGKSTQSKVKESKGKKSKEQIPYADIIDRLNEKAGKKFKPSANKTKDLIQARWNEGHRLDDFYAVIDYCSAKWSGETFSNGQKGDDYLQPSTLFNGKFDERLNWTLKKEEVPSKPKESKAQREQREMMEQMRRERMAQ